MIRWMQLRGAGPNCSEPQRTAAARRRSGWRGQATFLGTPGGIVPPDAQQNSRGPRAAASGQSRGSALWFNSNVDAAVRPAVNDRALPRRTGDRGGAADHFFLGTPRGNVFFVLPNVQTKKLRPRIKQKNTTIALFTCDREQSSARQCSVVQFERTPNARSWRHLRAGGRSPRGSCRSRSRRGRVPRR